MGKELSCGAVVFRRDDEIKYLVLHYPHGYWDFTRGNEREEEPEEETARRELEEETGIDDAVFIDGFKEKVSFFYKRSGEIIFKEVLYFLAETKQKNVKLSFEHIGYKWLSFDYALKQLSFGNSREILKKANEFLMR